MHPVFPYRSRVIKFNCASSFLRENIANPVDGHSCTLFYARVRQENKIARKTRGAQGEEGEEGYMDMDKQKSWERRMKVGRTTRLPNESNHWQYSEGGWTNTKKAALFLALAFSPFVIENGEESEENNGLEALFFCLLSFFTPLVSFSCPLWMTVF